jgi:hypothetical protein
VQRKAVEKEQKGQAAECVEKKEKNRRRKRNALERLKKSLLAKGRREQAARIVEILHRLPKGEEVRVTKLRKRARRAAAFRSKKASGASTLIARGLENGWSGGSAHQSFEEKIEEGLDMTSSVSFAEGDLKENVQL